MTKLAFADRVQEFATNVGQGTVALLGASASNLRTFAQAGLNGQTVPYVILHRTSNQWEIGYGVYTQAGAALTRVAVLSNSLGTTNLVAFLTGEVDVWNDLPASKIVALDADSPQLSLPGNVVTPGTITATTFVGALDWVHITNKPTTLAGYGITDAFTQAQADLRYAPIAGPFPWAGVTGTPTTLAGYGITDAQSSTGPIAWSRITATPTTLAGYGITDSLTLVQADARYAPIAGPFAWAHVTGTPTTLAGYGITDAQSATGPVAWSRITGTPTTIAGYGITDAFTQAQADARYDPLGGSIAWTRITGHPTTVAGYGITDAFTQAQADARYDPLGGSIAWTRITGTPTTLAGYGITDAQSATGPVAWSRITGTPTTVAGYGITDVYTMTQSDARYAPIGSGGSGLTHWQELSTGQFVPIAGNTNPDLGTATTRTRSIYATTQIDIGGLTNPANWSAPLISLTPSTLTGTTAIVRLGDPTNPNASVGSMGYFGTSTPTSIGVLNSAAGQLLLSSSNGPITFATVVATAGIWQFTPTGMLLTVADGAYDIGASGANRPRNLYLTGTITAATLVGALAWSSITGHPTTIAGYGITDAFTQTAADARYAPIAGPFPWADVTGKPTTLAGYGITDAAPAAGPFPWAGVTGHPTTLGGYGITDAVQVGTITAPMVGAGTYPAGAFTYPGALTVNGLATVNNNVNVTAPNATLTVTGTTSAFLWIDGPAGIARTLAFSTAGSSRWRLNADGSPESAGDVGSNLTLVAFGNTGTNLGNVFAWPRTAGGALQWNRPHAITDVTNTSTTTLDVRNTNATFAGTVVNIQPTQNTSSVWPLQVTLLSVGGQPFAVRGDGVVIVGADTGSGIFRLRPPGSIVNVTVASIFGTVSIGAQPTGGAAVLMLSHQAPTGPNRFFARFDGANGTVASIGADGSDNLTIGPTNAVVIGADPGGTQLLRVGGGISAQQGVQLTANLPSGAPGPGLFRHATAGLILVGAAGTSYDFALYNSSVAQVMVVPTGTQAVQFFGSIYTPSTLQVVGAVTFNNGPVVLGTDPGGTQILRVGGSINISGQYLVNGVAIGGGGPFSALTINSATGVNSLLTYQINAVNEGFVGVAGAAGSIVNDAAANDLVVRTQGTAIRFSVNSGTSSAWEISATGMLLPGADNTYDIGAGGFKPRSVYAYSISSVSNYYLNGFVILGQVSTFNAFYAPDGALAMYLGTTAAGAYEYHYSNTFIWMNRAQSGSVMQFSATGPGLAIGAGITPAYPLHVEQSTTGAPVAVFRNTNATAANDYGIAVQFPNASPNNATNYFLLCSDSGGTKAEIFSNGNGYFAGSFQVAQVIIQGGGFSAGSIYKNASGGLIVAAATGTSFDFQLLTPGGTAIATVATGTTTMTFTGGVSVTGTLTVGTFAPTSIHSVAQVTVGSMAPGVDTALITLPNASTQKCLWIVPVLGTGGTSSLGAILVACDGGGVTYQITDMTGGSLGINGLNMVGSVLHGANGGATTLTNVVFCALRIS